MMRFASNFFDGNKTALSRIDDFERLDRWMNEVGVEQQFLNYAAKVENLKPAAGEWEKTKWYMMPQVKALVGRYSKLQDEAFYRFYLPIDNEFQTALTEQ
jgi:carboxyl-terminal processing protease